MEIASFILGVCTVIVLLMVAGTSVNYIAFKTLKRDFDNYVSRRDKSFSAHLQDNEITRQELNSRIKEIEQTLVRHTDSRVDKLQSNFSVDINNLYSEVDKLKSK